MTSSNGNIFRVTGHFAGNSPVPGLFLPQRPVTRSFAVFFDLRLNKRLSKQSWGWWLETLSCPLWRHRKAILVVVAILCRALVDRVPNKIETYKIIWWPIRTFRVCVDFGMFFQPDVWFRAVALGDVPRADEQSCLPGPVWLTRWCRKPFG